MALTTDELSEALRKRLIEHRQSAQGLLGSLRNAVKHRPQDDCECATDIEVTTQIRTAELRLAELDEALERLEAGTYGICVTCGEAISLDRLDALPWTESCRQCA